MGPTEAGLYASHDVMIPPLGNGDCLSRAEFERRYHAMPQLNKAELIQGMVYVPSPVRHRLHGRPHTYIMAWLTI